MNPSSWFIDLDQVHSSYLLLLTLASGGLAAGALLQIGLIGWVVRLGGWMVGESIRNGFSLWERLLAWASWPLFLAIVLALIVGGVLVGWLFPPIKIVCGLAPLLMGTLACLAYMFIDLERYEVERGHKAVHNPLHGQELAAHVARYGQQVRIPLLLVASVSVVLGFALLNQGLYETIGPSWYTVEGGQGGPGYVDFLACALINLLGIVDLLHLAQTHHFLRAAYVHPALWPASILQSGFRMFFVFVLLQQFFASLRQGKLLAETITDFWSPHDLIHERARHALPQYGSLAIRPLLQSLRSVPSLTREQQVQLPLILATIGPSTIPELLRHLHDSQAHVRAIAVAALGHLHAREAVSLLVTLAEDPSTMVRQSLVEALGLLGSATTPPSRKRRGVGRGPGTWSARLSRLFRRKRQSVTAPLPDPVELALVTLDAALADESAAVRTQAARALGRIGLSAAGTAPGLITLLKDTDETVRCQAIEALGQVCGENEARRNAESLPADLSACACAALMELLSDGSAPVKAAAARALGALKTAASAAVPALIPLLQDREAAVRTAAAEAIAQVGPLNTAAIQTLVEGLASPDNVIRAQMAKALGTIGTAAEEATPALVEAMEDSNDRVRAKAVQALGRIGEGAAEAAVPGLMRALRDQDNWVSALAAEALGQMGESADGAIPALLHCLEHRNSQVRGNAAEALSKMGGAAEGARRSLETAAQDEDSGVRRQSIRALGALGAPTPASADKVLAALHDTDPLVRAAAVESLGQWGEASTEALNGLMLLLEDANDQVKVETVKVLPKLAGATPAVLDGLCRRLIDDDSTWVRVNAALALGKLGPAAAAAGGALLCAAQTGAVDVREQAMRAIAMIQPPEILAAFTAGLQDANGNIRKVASGGWMKAAFIPAAVVPALVVALRDPEVQVRMNAARALARLDALPTEALPLLIVCAADPNDGLRLTAAMVLQAAPPNVVSATMGQLVEDTNLRIRLIAAGALLAVDLDNLRAGAVLVEALSDPNLRIRSAALELVESFGTRSSVFLEPLKNRVEQEGEWKLRETLVRLLESLGNPTTVMSPLSGS